MNNVGVNGLNNVQQSQLVPGDREKLKTSSVVTQLKDEKEMK